MLEVLLAERSRPETQDRSSHLCCQFKVHALRTNFCKVFFKIYKSAGFHYVECATRDEKVRHVNAESLHGQSIREGMTVIIVN